MMQQVQNYVVIRRIHTRKILMFLRYMGDTVVEPETDNSKIYFKADKDIFLQTDSASPSTDNLIIKPFFFE